jgi:hypothetical protein
MAPITHIIYYIVIENERHNEQHYCSINNNKNKDLLCDRHESSHGVWRIGGNDCQGKLIGVVVVVVVVMRLSLTGHSLFFLSLSINIYIDGHESIGTH